MTWQKRVLLGRGQLSWLSSQAIHAQSRRAQSRNQIQTQIQMRNSQKRSRPNLPNVPGLDSGKILVAYAKSWEDDALLQLLAEPHGDREVDSIQSRVI